MTAKNKQPKNRNTKNVIRKRKNLPSKKIKKIPQPIVGLLQMMFQENFKGSQSTAYSRYKTLNTKIRLLKRNTIEHKMIRKYVKNSHGPTHNFKVKVEYVYTAARAGEYKKYKPKKKYRHRRLLWHGTPAENYPSILQNGLLIKPPNGVATVGSMFGNGLYFADSVTKSAQYCRATPIYPYGIMILAEVALGKHWYLTTGKNVTQLNYGKKSVKGLGRYKSDRTKTIKNKYGTKVPLGKLQLQKNLVTNLDYNEYIVYNQNQILINYLVLVKFY